MPDIAGSHHRRFRHKGKLRSDFHPPINQTKLAEFHGGIWWGALMGTIDIVKCRPKRAARDGTSAETWAGAGRRPDFLRANPWVVAFSGLLRREPKAPENGRRLALGALGATAIQLRFCLP